MPTNAGCAVQSKFQSFYVVLYLVVIWRYLPITEIPRHNIIKYGKSLEYNYPLRKAEDDSFSKIKDSDKYYDNLNSRYIKYLIT